MLLLMPMERDRNILKFCYEFTEGRFFYSDIKGEISFEAHLNDGTIIPYNIPRIDSYTKY